MSTVVSSWRDVLAGWVANLAGSAAHQDDWFQTAFLHPTEQHDLDETAGM